MEEQILVCFGFGASMLSILAKASLCPPPLPTPRGAWCEQGVRRRSLLFTIVCHFQTATAVLLMLITFIISQAYLMKYGYLSSLVDPQDHADLLEDVIEALR